MFGAFAVGDRGLNWDFFLQNGEEATRSLEPLQAGRARAHGGMATMLAPLARHFLPKLPSVTNCVIDL